MGRPPKPLEEKRRTGRQPGRDSGGRPLPVVAEVVALQPADGTPDYPPELGLDGQRLWRRAWGAAITWLSPDSDMETVEEACRIADDLAAARRRYRVTTEPADGRMVKHFHEALAMALSSLGFDPTARARLGVAEVKRVSALDELIQRRRNRTG